MSPSATLSGAALQLWPLLALVGIVVGLVLVLGPDGSNARARNTDVRTNVHRPIAATPIRPLSPLISTLLNVEVEVQAVLRELAPAAAGRLVRLELAVQPSLCVRADGGVFREVLSALVRHAIAQAPSGRVLVAGSHHGGRVQLAVLDDGIGADPQAQASELRASERLIALQGGTLEINSRAGEGSTVLARWPDASGERKSTVDTRVGATVPDASQVATKEGASAREKAVPR